MSENTERIFLMHHGLKRYSFVCIFFRVFHEASAHISPSISGGEVVTDLKEARAKRGTHTGSPDQVVDWRHVGSPADVPDGTSICRTHVRDFAYGHCPKCGAPEE